MPGPGCPPSKGKSSSGCYPNRCYPIPKNESDNASQDSQEGGDDSSSHCGGRKGSGLSRKYQMFVSEPMEDKPASTLPGLSKMSECRLMCVGCGTAYAVLGKYLTLDRNLGQFKHWLHEVAGTNCRNATLCYNAIADWCNNFL